MSQLKGWLGEKDNADLIAAAEGQGWTVQRTNHHIRFVPCDKSKPMVVFANTPSARKGPRRRLNDIQNLKRSGLIWPWPPTGSKKKAAIKAATNGHNQEETMATIGELTTEQWRVIDLVSTHEISNGARCRERKTGKIVVPFPNGIVRLLDDAGHVREKSVKVLCRTHFGHSPIKNVVPEIASERLRGSEVKALMADTSTTDPAPEGWTQPDWDNAREAANKMDEMLNINQEDEVTATLEKEPEVRLTPGWKLIAWVPDVDSYEVHPDGIVRRLGSTTPLSASKIGIQRWISLHRSDRNSTRPVRLDKLVLRAFGGEPANEKDAPVHKDNNYDNCRLSNLSWPGSSDVATPAFRQRGETVVELPEPEPESPEPEVVVTRNQTPEERLMGLPYEDRILEILEQVKPEDVPIELLDFSVRTYNLVKREGLVTTGKLAALTRAQIRELPTCRVESLDEIVTKLKDVGLVVAPGAPTPPPANESPAEAKKRRDRERHRRLFADKKKARESAQQELIDGYVERVVAEAPPASPFAPTPEKERAVRAKVPRAKRAKASAPRAPRGGNLTEVQVTRVYRNPATGLMVSIGADGRSSLSKKLDMSTAEMTALAAISKEIAEFNKMMGI